MKSDAHDFITFALGVIFGAVLMWLLFAGGFEQVRV